MKKITYTACNLVVFMVFMCVTLTVAKATGTVVAFGDSITEGNGLTPYSTFLQTKVGKQATVINEGLRGEQTGGGASRIGGVLANDKPNYILIMEGANDAIWGISSSTVKYNLGVMIDKSIAAGATPIISTITPDTNPAVTLTLSIANDYNQKIAGLAAERGVTLVDSYAAVAGSWGSLTTDGLHVNAAGAEILAYVFFNALRKAVKEGHLPE